MILISLENQLEPGTVEYPPRHASPPAVRTAPAFESDLTRACSRRGSTRLVIHRASRGHRASWVAFLERG